MSGRETIGGEKLRSNITGWISKVYHAFQLPWLDLSLNNNLAHGMSIRIHMFTVIQYKSMYYWGAHEANIIIFLTCVCITCCTVPFLIYTRTWSLGVEAGSLTVFHIHIHMEPYFIVELEKQTRHNTTATTTVWDTHTHTRALMAARFLISRNIVVPYNATWTLANKIDQTKTCKMNIYLNRCVYEWGVKYVLD